MLQTHKTHKLRTQLFGKFYIPIRHEAKSLTSHSLGNGFLGSVHLSVTHKISEPKLLLQNMAVNPIELSMPYMRNLSSYLTRSSNDSTFIFIQVNTFIFIQVNTFIFIQVNTFIFIQVNTFIFVQVNTGFKYTLLLYNTRITNTRIIAHQVTPKYKLRRTDALRTDDGNHTII